jgi:hypothetical protein
MSIPTDRLHNLAFTTDFDYLHVIKSGTATADNKGNSAVIPLPLGLTKPLFMVYQKGQSGFVGTDNSVIPVTGFFATASEAYIAGVNLHIVAQHSQAAGSKTITTVYYYFIFGGNYDNYA